MREKSKEWKNAEPGSEKIITKQSRMRRRHSVDTWPCMIPWTETKHIYDSKEEEKRRQHQMERCPQSWLEKPKNSSWKKVMIKSERWWKKRKTNISSMSSLSPSKNPINSTIAADYDQETNAVVTPRKECRRIWWWGRVRRRGRRRLRHRRWRQQKCSPPGTEHSAPWMRIPVIETGGQRYPFRRRRRRRRWILGEDERDWWEVERVAGRGGNRRVVWICGLGYGQCWRFNMGLRPT